MGDADRLPRSFYRAPPLAVARALLGKVVVNRGRGGSARAGVIVEVEAYGGEDDPACHAAAGLTARNAPLYGPPGYAYVYLNYGIHYLLNAVAGPAGFPAAVLIRALSPLEGLDAMRRRRSGRRGAPPPADETLCRGPGNLTRALGVSLRQNRLDLCGRRLYIEDRGLPCGEVRWGPRIGITVGTGHRWRGYLADCPAVSRGGLP